MSGNSKPLTRFIGENIEKEISELKSRPGKNIVMFGSPGLAKSMIRAGLIDEFWLFVNPIIRGDGNALFEPGLPQTKLTLKKSESMPSGVTILHYIKQ
jgi:dihydrofolate reductase